VVPCFVRRQFNKIVGRILDAVSTDGKEYNLNVKKIEYKTTIFGTAYQELMRDYDINDGERIRIKWDHSGQFAIFPQCKHGYELPRVYGKWFCLLIPFNSLSFFFMF
jgi:hypothetical protein